MKKVIVTGGDGFVGSALVEELKRRGVIVTVVDRKRGGDAARDVPKILERGGYDTVFHLAAQTSVWNEDYDAILYDNVETFITVCKACRHNHVKLVYASSSTANPCNTTSFYGMTKRMNEEIAQHFYATATGVRLHNVYGPRQRKGTLLWYLSTARIVTLYNNGENTRCFTFIDDAVDGLIWAAAQSLTLVNVVAPATMTVRQFAEEVQKYRPQLILINKPQMRELDNIDQSVNVSIKTAPLDYTSVEDGLARIFNETD